jgi:hypothetical protein
MKLICIKFFPQPFLQWDSNHFSRLATFKEKQSEVFRVTDT